MKVPLRLCTLVVNPRQAIFERQEVFWLETDVSTEQVFKASDEQATADQQQNRERDLSGDRSAANAIPPATIATAFSLPQAGLQFRSGKLQRGNEPKNQTHNQRSADSKEQNRRVNRRRLSVNKTLWYLKQRPQRPVRDEHAGETAQQGEQGAFHQQLPHQSRPARSESGTQSDLALPSQTSSEQKICEVCASDQQNDASGGKQ